jgi:hypothetical protein
MKTTTPSRTLAEPFRPRTRVSKAALRRGILVEFFGLGAESPWFALVHGPRGTNVHATGETIPAARRRARAELAAVAGRTRAAELWRNRVETMPAGAEEEEARKRRLLTSTRRARATAKR